MARRSIPDPLSETVEAHRDIAWRRLPELTVDTVEEAERFVTSVGIAWTLTDVRTPGPSLYIAVCGRRDAHMPPNVQKDPEASAAWLLKDDLARRGRVFYGKVLRKRSTLIARELITPVHALLGIPKKDERTRLSPEARAVLAVLRKEWEMASSDLRKDSGIEDRARFNKAMDELQACMKVIPAEVLYVPKFTYIWALAEGRFVDEIRAKLPRVEAVARLARAYLGAAGQTARGELSSVLGIGRAEAGKANHALVDEGFAIRVSDGVYRLASLVA
jgi:hypothetical protein